MGYYSIFKYFIRRLFYFLRSITGKLFMIFILLFCVLILYMCIDKGVFAESNILFDNIFTQSDISRAQSLAGNIWTNDDYDIFLGVQMGWGNISDGSGRGKMLFYFKYDKNFNDSNYIIDNSNGLTTYTNSSSSPSYSYYYYKYFYFNNNSNCTLTDWRCVGLYTNNQNYHSSVSGTNIQLEGVICNQNINSNYFYFLPIRTHFNIYDSFGNLVFAATNPIPRDPYIENQSSNIESWSFDYLKINSGSVGYVYYDPLLDRSTYSDLYLKYVYDGITYSMPINSGFLSEWSTDNFIVEIPRTSLLTSVNIQNGKSVDFYLEVKQQNVGDNIYYLGNYTFSLTTEEQEQIQSDSDKALQGQILQQQEQINNNLSNIDNSINNSSIDDITSDTLPSDTTTDITADGVNGIFTSIYNAFCVGNAQDIVFPIPFTDKSITLPSNYVRNALNSSGATFIITLIEAFWWYLISRYIVKDIMNKINKIKSGNIEDIETTNIRGDML